MKRPGLDQDRRMTTTSRHPLVGGRERGRVGGGGVGLVGGAGGVAGGVLQGPARVAHGLVLQQPLHR